MSVSILGDWDVTIKTPVGSVHVLYRFVDDGGVISGSAASKSETVPLTDIAIVDDVAGQRVRWRQTVTKPMRLKLDFDVRLQGDRLSGHSRAGRLPRSDVSGMRRG